MITDVRQSAARHDATLRQRLDTIVPLAMQRAELDAWVIIGREYAEGPVLRTMLPATWITARRRTILVFLRTGQSVERLAVARYAVDDLFPSAWDPDTQPDQMARLAELLVEAAPRRIGIDVSGALNHGDGLSATDHDLLRAALPPELASRLVPAELAAMVWLQTRDAAEVVGMRTACAHAHALLARALSSEVITPGRTTTADVEWWLRQAVHADGLGSWFHPSTSVQRGGDGPTAFASHPGDDVIEPGDLVHIDFGLIMDDLCTDQQQHGYVLRPKESEPPTYLVDALRIGNRLQDIVMAELRPGRTGNEVLAEARAVAAKESIDASIYSHPIGLHGHGAGPAIGLWDRQDGVPGSGDLPIDLDTCWSIELAAMVEAPAWGGRIAIRLEEDAHLDAAGTHWLDGRQTALHVIG